MSALVPLQTGGGSAASQLFLLAGVFAVLGYLIRFHQMTGLIAGVDPDRAPISEEAAANLFGTALFVVSLVTLGYAVALYQGMTGGLFRGAWLVIMLGVVAITFLRAYDYIPGLSDL